MPIYSKESLDTLRQRIDLTDVVSSYVDLKRTGASYKGLCPFHDEKTPSFVIQKGDTHYHCFGCGAHGDAVQFLMTHLRLPFVQAIENLADRFKVVLQVVEGSLEAKGPNKAELKAALDFAAKFFQFILLHTAEGHSALEYLFKRGIDLDFIYRFGIGLSPKEPKALQKASHAKFIKDETLAEAGLLVEGRDGRWKDFFFDRITFPICDAAGAVIGFSARKYRQETFGGKYINTQETSLFKKSKVLFGLHHSRRRIAKDRTAIIVEGQIDALRLISMGLNIAVAGQGTAFGEGHLKELLTLGVNRVYLAFDGDEAGTKAAVKIGNMFQREGVAVYVVAFGAGQDPDSYLLAEGTNAFIELLKASPDYLTFLVDIYSKQFNADTPAGKNELVQTLIKQVRSWDNPLMVHESLRKVAHLTKVPESMVGVGEEFLPNVYIKKSASIGLQTIDPDKIMESDLLRWLVLAGNERSHFVKLAMMNVNPKDFRTDVCRRLYEALLECGSSDGPFDLLALAIRLGSDEGQELLSGLLEKKVNLERSKEHFKESLQKILDRNWMEECETLKGKIHSAEGSDEEVLLLVKKFDELKKKPPIVREYSLYSNDSAHI